MPYHVEMLFLWEKNRFCRVQPDPPTSISRAKNWWKQMSQPKEQVAEVSARETQVDPMQT